MSDASTASCSRSWAQSCLAFVIVRLRLMDAARLASPAVAERASVCATLHASFHHLALFGSGIRLGFRVRRLVSKIASSKALREAWTVTAMADHLEGVLS